MRIQLVIASLTMAAFSSATLIDDFLPIDHANDLTLQGPNLGGRGLVGSFTGTMLGGERDVELAQDDDTGGRYAQTVARYETTLSGGFDEYYRVGGIGSGLGGATDCVTILQYDGVGDEVGNIGLDRRLRAGGSGVPLVLASEGGIRIWYRSPGSSDDGVLTTVILRHLGNELAREEFRIGSNRPILQSAEFWFQPAALGQADSISIQFRAYADGWQEDALELDHIDTILPEPATVVPFGAAVGFWLLRRRPRV